MGQLCCGNLTEINHIKNTSNGIFSVAEPEPKKDATLTPTDHSSTLVFNLKMCLKIKLTGTFSLHLYNS
jgi:hypothetical protein